MLLHGLENLRTLKSQGNHFRFITIPSLLKKRINLKSNNYKNFLKRYMKYEITKGNNYNPSFYALVIHSNFRNKVF